MVRAVTPIPFVKARFFDRCGKPLADGKVYTYEANTTTPKVTYKDPYGLTPNTNPIILDAAGEADIYLDGTYRIRITDRNDVLVNDAAKIGSWFSDNLQDTLDNISGAMDDALKPILQNLENAINAAAAAGAGANGWTASLVQDASGQTQQQINDKTKKATEFYVTPQMFAPKGLNIGDGVVDASDYIIAALNSGHPVKLPVPSVKYRVTKNLVLNGNVLSGESASPELYGSATSRVIIEFDGASGDAVENINTLSTVKNIWFRQKDWSTTLNGLYLKRYAYFDDCMFTDFNGHGYYANAAPATISQNPFHTVFNRCQFLRNAKHGVGIFNGANAISFYDCLSRWNGAPSYGVAPTVAGVWDGLCIDGYNADFPASSTKMEPQGLLVIGGDWSYNSRYGQNWHKAFDSVVIGGYLENNLVNDFRVGASYSLNIVNPMTRTSPVLECVDVDPVESSIRLFNYANSIFIRGQDYGNGLKPAGANNRSYNKTLPAFYSLGSSTITRMYGSVTGSIIFDGDFPTNVEFKPNVAVKLPRYRFGNVTGVTDSNAANYLAANDNVEGSAYFNIIADGQYGKMSVANGGGANAAACFFQMPKNSKTSRSINAGGTINANGADYAEYMYKSDGCGDIQKGEIVGVNTEGKLTKLYDESVSFVVKSTDPSIVGGDTWFSDEFGETEPQYSFDKKLAEDATQDEIDEFNQLKSEYITQLKSEITSYKQRKADFDERMELARQKVDRIAFCGQVPISYVAEVGDYIIPLRKSDGTIGIETTKALTFEQFLKCVGKVWYVNNGVAHIVIFNN